MVRLGKAVTPASESDAGLGDHLLASPSCTFTPACQLHSMLVTACETAVLGFSVLPDPFQPPPLPPFPPTKVLQILTLVDPFPYWEQGTELMAMAVISCLR